MIHTHTHTHKATTVVVVVAVATAELKGARIAKRDRAKGQQHQDGFALETQKRYVATADVATDADGEILASLPHK